MPEPLTQNSYVPPVLRTLARSRHHSYALLASGCLSEVWNQNGCGASPNNPAAASQTRDPSPCMNDAAVPNTSARHDLHVHQSRGNPYDACRRDGADYHGDRRDPDHDPGPAGT